MLRAVCARSIRGRCSSSVVCVVRRIHIDNGDEQRTTSRRRYRRIGGADAQTPALWHESGPSTSSARMDGTTHTMPTRSSSLPLHWSVQLKTGRHFSRRFLVLLAEQCLREESPLLYRVHRQGVEAQSTPQDFLQLIRLLASAGLAMDVGARVVALLLDALHKTPHPVRGALSAWDLEDDEMRQVKADAMAVIANASDGTAALAWLSAVLMPAEEMDPVPTTSSSSSSIPSITHLVLARLDAVAAGNARQLVLRGVDEDGDALLLHPLLLTAVCRAMVRSSPQVQAQVLHLLERCASTRFVCGSDVHLVFGQLNVEELIVASAEAAALIGETELVTRLIFLMYRFRGLLGQSSLGAASTNTGSGESSGWLTRLRARISTTWRSETAMEAEINAYFEAAVVRLLRSAIAAVLRSAPNDDVLEGGGSMPSVQEALELLSGLSKSSTCAGQAAMTMELLHFLGHEQQQRFSIMRGSNTVVDASVAQHVEHTKTTALGVVEKLARRVQVSCRAFPTQKEELQEMLVVCVVEAMRVFIPEIHDEKESFLATFLPQKMHDAKDVLQLIHMVDVAHRVTLLPSVMAVASQCWLHKDEPSLIHTSAEKDQMQHLIREVLRCANLLHDGGTVWLWWSMLHAMAPTASPLRYWQVDELSRGASVEMLCRETSVHQRRRLWRFLRHTLPQMPRAVCALHGALLAQAATSIISTRTSCAASTTTLHEEEELLHLLYRCGDVHASVVRAANRLVCAMLDGSSLLTFSMTDLWSGCGRAAMEHIIVCVDPRLLRSQSPVSLRSNITRSMAELPGGVLASFAALIAAPLLRFSNTRQRTSTVQVTYVLSSSSVSLMARDASPLMTVEEDDVVVVDALHFHQQQPTHYNSSSLARPFLRALVQHHDGDPLAHTEAVEGGVVEWCVRIASPWHLTQHNECHGGVEEAADAARAVMQSMEHHVKLPASNTKVVVWSEEEEEERSMKLHSAVKLTSVRRAQSAKAQCEIGRILRDGGDVRRAQRPHTRVAATNNANRVSSLLDSLERSKAARRSPSS